MRPLYVFTAIASAMVTWLAVRMFGAGSAEVWALSCLLGSWAPFIGAAIFLYIRDEGHREDTVFAAWMVRAIAMHCTLAWLLGVSDLLQGPPHAISQWNADVGAPLVFISLAPAFLLAFATMSWARRVATSLDLSQPSLREHGVDRVSRAPYRGAAVPYLTTTIDTRSRLATLAPALVGLSFVLGARVLHLSAMFVLPAAVLSLALATTTRRGVAWSALSITAMSAMLQAPTAQTSFTHMVHDLVAWPWLAMLSFVAFLVVLEARRFLSTRVHATTFHTSN